MAPGSQAQAVSPGSSTSTDRAFLLASKCLKKKDYIYIGVLPPCIAVPGAHRSQKRASDTETVKDLGTSGSWESNPGPL